MPLKFHQTPAGNRLNVSFCNDPVEGYLQIVDLPNDNFTYLPFDLDGKQLTAEPIDGPFAAALVIVTDYQTRELAVIDDLLAELERSHASATGLALKLLPRRIQNTRERRASVASGKFM
jgi:hypothetical protein